MATKLHHYAIEIEGWNRITYTVYAENHDMAFKAALDHAEAREAELYGPYNNEAEMSEALYCIDHDC